MSLRSDSPLDFSQSRLVGQRIKALNQAFPHLKGYDHTYVLDSTAHNKAQLTLSETQSGRCVRMFGNFPCLQLYSGEGLFGQEGYRSQAYPQFSGLALELQDYPNAINVSSFPGGMITPEQGFSRHQEWHFSTLA